jgi:hypothetical protein
MEEIDEDAVSEDEGSAQEERRDQDDGGDLDEGEPYSSDDELDCFRDMDESVDALKNETPNMILDIEQDLDTSIAESLFTVPDGSAPQVITEGGEVEENAYHPFSRRHPRSGVPVLPPLQEV